MSGYECDVCGRPSKLINHDGKQIPVVASSSLGPISFAYCQECLDRGAEPLAVWHGTIWCVGGHHHIRLDLVLGACSWLDGAYVGWATIVATYREDAFS